MAKQNDKQIKRFFAPTMRRALDLVTEEMGPEAVILSSRKIDGGVEIMTSIDRDLPTRGIESRRSFGQNFDAEYDTPMATDSAWKFQSGIEKASSLHPAKAEKNGPASAVPSQNLAAEIERAREKMLAAKRLERESIQQKQSDDITRSKKTTRAEIKTNIKDAAANEKRLEELQSELADMRMLLEQQLWHMSKNREVADSLTHPENIVSVGDSSSKISSRQHHVLQEHLVRLGLPSAMISTLTKNVSAEQRANESWRQCMSMLAKKIPTTTENLVNEGGIFAFVGQTGVGKTTSIAKLAAKYLLDHGPGKVALVTTDTYRVGAYEQLKSLGKILNVPVRAVDKQNSLVTTLASLKNFELVLIDTAGFRHGDPLLKAQLAELDTCAAAKRLLVMSCNSQLQMLKASLHAYSSRRDIDACIITKLDEAASLGEALGVVAEHKIPVAYTTDGQEIPKDICSATGQRLVAKAVQLMKAEWNNTQSGSME